MRTGFFRAAMLAATVLAALGLPAISATRAEAGWGDGSGKYNEDVDFLTCGAVFGMTGVLDDFDSTDPGGTTFTTTGGVGTWWDGEQYGHRDDDGHALPVVLHSFTTDTATQASLSVSLKSSTAIKGTAHRWQAGQWWWDSHNTVIESQPSASAYVPGEGFVDLTITWSQNVQCFAYGGDYGDQHPTPPAQVSSNNDETTVPPSSSSQYGSTLPPPLDLRTNGNSVGMMGLPAVAGASVTVTATWATFGSGCVDNARVTDDELKLTFTLKTAIQN